MSAACNNSGSCQSIRIGGQPAIVEQGCRDDGSQALQGISSDVACHEMLSSWLPARLHTG